MADIRDRGFVLLHRKFWDNPILKESNKPFSKREAWLYLFSNLANGVDRNGVPRGEFKASIRFLCQAWNWDRDKVHRFLILLRKENMINALDENRNPIPVGQFIGQKIGHFTISNYETYQVSSDKKSDTKSDKSKEGKKESIKERKIEPEESVFKIISKSGNEVSLTQSKIDEWKNAYPGVDVDGELIRMKQWSTDNKEKRKTERGMYGFISRWLAREFKAIQSQKILSSFNFGEKI